uniref:Uncharacterized protein n=1 Tax=Opuntia streptacantha TaxID=393608 RepID=A0A7C9DXR2_OPUST
MIQMCFACLERSNMSSKITKQVLLHTRVQQRFQKLQILKFYVALQMHCLLLISQMRLFRSFWRHVNALIRKRILRMWTQFKLIYCLGKHIRIGDTSVMLFPCTIN